MSLILSAAQKRRRKLQIWDAFNPNEPRDEKGRWAKDPSYQKMFATARRVYGKQEGEFFDTLARNQAEAQYARVNNKSQVPEDDDPEYHALYVKAMLSLKGSDPENENIARRDAARQYKQVLERRKAAALAEADASLQARREKSAALSVPPVDDPRYKKFYDRAYKREYAKGVTENIADYRATDEATRKMARIKLVERGTSGTPKEIAFFHGTAEDAEASILKEGLVPKGGPGADDWGTRNHFVVAATGGKGRDASVFFAGDPYVAERYANLLAKDHHCHGVVMKITVPPEEADTFLSKVKGDEASDPGAWRYVGKIPPKWISVLKKVDGSGDTVTIDADDDSIVFYAVVLAKPDMADGFDPNEPRDDHGRWTALLVHGGSDFDAIDMSKLGTGEPGNIRPLGKGLYGYLVKPGDRTGMMQAVDFAKRYASKYGKGEKTIHVFKVNSEGALIQSNGPSVSWFKSKLPPDYEAALNAYGEASKLPVGPDRSAAFEAAQKQMGAVPKPNWDMRVETLPAGLTEAAVVTPSRLQRVGKWPVTVDPQALASEVIPHPDFTPPTKTVTAYKLFATKKDRPGEIFPLFIGAKEPTPQGDWVPAQHIPTKGFAERPGWHAGVLPMAPHLRTKQGRIQPGRVWAEVEMPADVDWQPKADASKTRDIRNEVPVGGFYRFKTNKMQGGAWMIGGALKVKRLLTNEDVREILTKAGHADQIAHELRDHSTPLEDAPRLSDPSGTSDLKTRFWRETKLRWRKAADGLYRALGPGDMLVVGNAQQPLATRADRLAHLQVWVDEWLRHCLGGTWTDAYVTEAAERAASRAAGLVEGTGRPRGRGPTAIMQTVAVGELQGIVDAVAQQVLRVVAQKMLEHAKPNAIAQAARDRLMMVGQQRSKMWVEYIVMKTFGSVTLDVFRDQGVTHVGLVPELEPAHVHDACTHGLVYDGGFDPNEPRNEKGEWVESGVGDDLVTLYHGTTPEGESGIRTSGQINAPAYFSPRREAAMEYAANNSDDPRVIEVRIPRSSLSADLEAGHDETDADVGSALQRGRSVYTNVPVRLRKTTTDSWVYDAPRKTIQKRHRKTGRFVSYTPPPAKTRVMKALRAERKLAKAAEQWGGEVDVMTAMDDRVCRRCNDIAEDGPYSLARAEALIPAHPNCRCVYVPAVGHMTHDEDYSLDAGFDPDEPRDEKGRWTTGSADLDTRASSTLKTLNERYPEAGGIDLQNDYVDAEDTLARHGSGHIYTGKAFTPEMFEKRVKEWNGMIVDPSVEGTIEHEFGHALASKIEFAIGHKKFWALVEKWYPGMVIDTTNTPSAYAMEDMFENIAETFVTYNSGGKKIESGGFNDKSRAIAMGMWGDFIEAARHPQKKRKSRADTPDGGKT